jgi:hypothetical protein
MYRRAAQRIEVNVVDKLKDMMALSMEMDEMDKVDEQMERRRKPERGRSRAGKGMMIGHFAFCFSWVFVCLFGILTNQRESASY